MKNHKSLIINHKSLPIQYTKGYVEFYKLRFKVTPDTLIPRPETELLVDEVLKCIKGNNIIILDVGTGAGNIAISVAKNAKDVQIIATDISKEALKIAKQNARLHRVKEQIRFIQSDLLSSVIPSNEGIQLSTSSSELDPRLPSAMLRTGRGDDNLIIVTNLPYIPSARIPYLDSSVKDFEPHIALDGGEDGFGLYRKLFAQIKEKHLKPKLIIGEIDYTHGELAYSEAQKYFPDYQVEIKTDLTHKQRILIISQDEKALTLLPV